MAFDSPSRQSSPETDADRDGDAGSNPLQPSPQYRTEAEPKLRILIPLVVACAFFMENLDSTIINTSIPQIAHSLGESPLTLNVAITCYLLSLAVFIPISGWMADRFGTRTVFTGAILMFTAGSVCCGLSETLLQLVAGRIVQGIGGAMMAPVGRIVLLRSFPKSQLITAMSYVTIPALIGPTVGPLLGGFITTYSSWRWIFYVNIPIGGLGIALAALHFENHRLATPSRFDLSGFLLCGSGLASAALAFDYAGRHVISVAANLGLIALAALLLGLYVLHSRRVAAPAVDLGLFRIKTFRISVVAGSVYRIGFGAIPFLLPLLFQLIFGLTPLGSGGLTFIMAIGAMAMKTAAPTIVRHFGFRRLLVANGLLSGLMVLALCLFDATTPHWFIVALLGLFGFIRSLEFTCINALAYADLPSDRMSRGTSLASVAQQLSISFGVATGATTLSLLIDRSEGMALTLDNFHVAFIVVGLLPILSAVMFTQLSPTDGSQVSGYQPARG
jgi:EmrB/QacA subfamily drug resistance transporter